MRLRKGVTVAVIATALSSAEADTLKRVVEAAGDGGGGAPPDDLSSWAGPARQTTLPDLLQVTVRQAPALRNAKLDIAIAEARIQQTWVRNDWLLRAQVTGSKSTGFFSGIAINNSESIGGTVDVTHVISTGGTLVLHAGTDYQKTEASGIGDSTNWRDELSLSFTQPLLRGAGSSYFDARERQAVLSRDASVLARRLAAIQVVQAVVSAYWDLVLAERQVAITQSALDLAKERLRITQIGADVGKLPRSEIPAVQQIIATREEDILNSELAVLERSIALRRVAGLPIGAGELGLRVDPDLAMRDATWDLGQLTDRAYAASPELAQLAKQDASVKIDIDVTENGLLPQLDAALAIGPTGQDESASAAAKQLAQFKAIAISGSLTYTQSLRRDDVRGRQREFRETLHKLEVNSFDIRAQIAQTMSRAVAGLELARRRVALSQRAIDLANENIKIESDRFNLGKATNFDVLNRQEELRQAELRKVQAMIDWHKSETVVQALTGDILPSFGVTLE